MTANPFAQSPAYWLLHFTLPQEIAMLADEYFSDCAVSVASVEIPETPHLWRMEVLYGDVPAEEDIARRLHALAATCATPVPDYSISRLESRDWLLAVKQDFPPLHIARFFIHGSHVTESARPGELALQIDAGLAFGSGEHATTSGCMLALEMLAKRRRFTNILDVGTGSGILAMAAAKRIPTARILAADIDPVAVRVTRENIALNHLSRHVQACVADGYDAPLIRASAPYDLIFANILARPLMKLAPDLAAHLAPNGMAILSGLLKTQATMVLSAHRIAGLRLHSRIILGDWATLILTR